MISDAIYAFNFGTVCLLHIFDIKIGGILWCLNFLGLSFSVISFNFSGLMAYCVYATYFKEDDYLTKKFVLLIEYTFLFSLLYVILYRNVVIQARAASYQLGYCNLQHFTFSFPNLSDTSNRSFSFHFIQNISCLQSKGRQKITN